MIRPRAGPPYARPTEGAEPPGLSGSRGLFTCASKTEESYNQQGGLNLRGLRAFFARGPSAFLRDARPLARPQAVATRGTPPESPGGCGVEAAKHGANRWRRNRPGSDWPAEVNQSPWVGRARQGAAVQRSQNVGPRIEGAADVPAWWVVGRSGQLGRPCGWGRASGASGAVNPCEARAPARPGAWTLRRCS